VLDPADTVPGDVRRILEAETVSRDIPVSGWSYDVATGLVSPVVPAASRRGRSA
jgi:carbonic anhydrase